MTTPERTEPISATSAQKEEEVSRTTERSVEEIVEASQCDAGDVVTGWVIQSDEVRNILQAERQKREKVELTVLRIGELVKDIYEAGKKGDSDDWVDNLLKHIYNLTQLNNPK